MNKTNALYNSPRTLKLFASMMYEGMLLFGVVFIVAYLFDTLTQSINPEKYMLQRQFILFLGIGTYLILSWKLRAQTVAMKAWHLKIISKSNEPLKWSQLILRYFLCWLLPLLGALIVFYLTQISGWNSFNVFIVITPFLNLIPPLFRKDKQLLHDVIAQTRIIDIRLKNS